MSNSNTVKRRTKKQIYDDAFNAWHIRVRQEVSEMVFYTRYVPRLEEPVYIYENDEMNANLFSVSTEDCFWLDSFTTKREAKRFIKQLGLKEVQ